ncbi:ABC transporter ATP-binding protein [Mesorhizobium sp. CU2]|uniref:ABC transporter ATP-binding protein n=1 Tax=unclassified Mesorhizobium TaxID=325217 RepID=UPI00112A9A59|nr:MULTISPECIES: ABC transporter ATP-binding protein [unclassified Mesorhizobium]TPN85633.1 ABC transporter ATP-binding protein [Mesorhizobium sp. CU3]TPO04714.1 ABC transporter ATP-binding protein [Mesorhizobium sp. CU2]
MSQFVSVRNVSRTFEGRGQGVTALSDVSLDIRPGEFVVLVGPSGCGKSTLLRSIAGLDLGFSGEILAGGQPVVGPNRSRGLVFQEARLLPWLTAGGNIAFGLRAGPEEKRARVGELLDLVGLAGFEDAYPHQLSGGMAQRVAIARALAPRPTILLMDEPFGALDAFTRIKLQDALRDIWRSQNVTTVFVTHDIDESLALGQRVVVMSARPGRISQVIEVDLPYPRDRVSEAFSRYRNSLMNSFGLH